LLAFAWVYYNPPSRYLLYPFCEEWAQQWIQEELEQTFMRAIAADLHLCLLLESVGERRNGFEWFIEVLAARFEHDWDEAFKEPTANGSTPREIGRYWCCWLTDFKRVQREKVGLGGWIKPSC
ncbi:MAG TPA: hypothetical protein V6D09_20360, partial [Leptolyngbyaceae cyanobacterium]